MLLTSRELEGITSRRITAVFRRWTRPTVKTGGRLRTGAGTLAISRVETCAPDTITVEDARRAGHPSLPALLDTLAVRPGTVYRITFGGISPDPRVALRSDAALSPEDVATISAALARMDARSRTGAWTQATLDAIRTHPGVLAATLAGRVGLDRDRFKQNVRKLKELGLTESLEIGYRLSPRGRAFLGRGAAAPTSRARRRP